LGYLGKTYSNGYFVGLKQQQNPKDDKELDRLVGQPNESRIHIGGISTLALLDTYTGSSVSTVSETFHKNFLGQYPSIPMSCMLDIECADGCNVYSLQALVHYR